MGYSPGTILNNRYRIESLLGIGGMGAVYKAHDLEQERTLALKVLQRSPENEQALIRFQREFSAMQKLDHPNIVKAYDFYEISEQVYFITMEYVEGQSLRKLCESRQGPLAVEEALSLLYGIAQGLQHAHHHGLVHRDIKPGNILITPDGTPKLVDFGIARDESSDLSLTTTGEYLGSPLYMSPEACLRKPTDARADIYSFGLIAYELLTGEHPFKKHGIGTVSIAHTSQPVRSLRERNRKLERWLDHLVLVCLEKDREERYQKIDTVVALLAERLGKAQPDLSAELQRSKEVRRKFLIRRDLRESKTGPKQILFSACAAAFVSATWFFFGSISNIASNALNLWLRGPISPPEEVLIVGIDDISYVQLNLSTRFPLPRTITAQALKRIQDDKPRMLFIDAIGRYEAEDPAANEALTEAIASGPTVMGKHIVFDPASEGADDPRFPSFELTSWDGFTSAARMVVPLSLRSKYGVINDIGITSNDEVPDDARVPLLGPVKEVAGINVAAPGIRDLINFYGPPGTIKRVSLFELFDNHLPEGFFKDRLVFFGSQSYMLEQGAKDEDTFMTPTALVVPMYGVEIHATIAGNLIQGSFTKRIPIAYEPWLVFAGSLLVLLGMSSRSLAQASLRGLTGLVSWFAVSYFSFRFFHYFIPGLVHFLFVGPLPLALLAIFRTQLISRSHEKTMSRLGLNTSAGISE